MNPCISLLKIFICSFGVMALILQYYFLSLLSLMQFLASAVAINIFQLKSYARLTLSSQHQKLANIKLSKDSGVSLLLFLFVVFFLTFVQLSINDLQALYHGKIAVSNGVHLCTAKLMQSQVMLAGEGLFEQNGCTDTNNIMEMPPVQPKMLD